VASILAKKRALRLERALVEIRRGPFGNLGNDDGQLLYAAQLFEAVAEKLDIPCRATITGDGNPYQGMIGRGEAILALYQIFEGSPTPALRSHLSLCQTLAEQAVGAAIGGNSRQLREVFATNLHTQCSSYDAFVRRAGEVLTEPRLIISSRAAGTLLWDLGGVRDAIVRLQISSSGHNDAAGVELLVLKGAIEVGEPIAAVRGGPQLSRALETCYTVT
jgi:hypothetical protein